MPERPKLPPRDGLELGREILGRSARGRVTLLVRLGPVLGRLIAPLEEGLEGTRLTVLARDGLVPLRPTVAARAEGGRETVGARVTVGARETTVGARLTVGARVVVRETVGVGVTAGLPPRVTVGARVGTRFTVPVRPGVPPTRATEPVRPDVV